VPLAVPSAVGSVYATDAVRALIEATRGAHVRCGVRLVLHRAKRHRPGRPCPALDRDRFVGYAARPLAVVVKVVVARPELVREKSTAGGASMPYARIGVEVAKKCRPADAAGWVSLVEELRDPGALRSSASRTPSCTPPRKWG